MADLIIIKLGSGHILIEFFALPTILALKIIFLTEFRGLSGIWKLNKIIITYNINNIQSLSIKCFT